MAGDQPLPDAISVLPSQPGFVLWFTGRPAAGKTTLARAVQQALTARQIHTVLLDSDELRKLLTPQPTYSDAERDWFYSVVAGLAAWLARSGINVLIAATANRRAYRQAGDYRRNLLQYLLQYRDKRKCQRRRSLHIHRSRQYLYRRRLRLYNRYIEELFL